MYDYAPPDPTSRGGTLALGVRRRRAPDRRAVLERATYQVGDAEAYKRHELNYKEGRGRRPAKTTACATTPSCWRA